MKSARLAPWLPFCFSLALSVIVLATSFATRSFEPGLPAFFCFLPFVAFFGTQAHLQSHKQIRDLRARIDQLEARIGTA